MRRGAAQSSRLAKLAGACVLVIGDGGVTPSMTGGLPIVRRAPGDNLDSIVPALVVVDFDAYSIEALATVTRAPAIDGTPILVVADGAIDDSVLDALGASDVTTRHAISARRIASLTELGLSRFALSIAEQALEHTVNGLTVADMHAPDSPLVYVSPVFESLSGYAAEEALGRNARFLQGSDPASSELNLTQLREGQRQRARATAVLRNFRKDGTAFWNEVTLFPIVVNGQPTRWMGGVQHDVTCLRNTQAEVADLCRLLAAQQAFVHAILDGVEVGIVTTDRDGLVTFANRSALRMLQRRKDALRDKSVTEILPLEKAPRELLGLAERRSLSCTITRGDGSELEVDVSVTRADATNDDRVGFFLIFRDVDADRQFESERRRFDRLVAMGTMVAGFAHEIRNPVAALRSITEELAEELAESGSHLPHMRRMLRVLERIERLVRTSLAFGRPAAPKPAHHRPWAILSSALASVSPRTRGVASELRVEADTDLPDVFCDDAQVAQAIVVLLNNALDATGDPSRVLVRATQEALATEHRVRKSEPPPGRPRWVRFDVVDDGPGIAPEFVEQIFDPFFTTKAEGTGLGLSIAQQIVSENHGRLEVASARGGPTTFRIIIPTSS